MYGNVQSLLSRGDTNKEATQRLPAEGELLLVRGRECMDFSLSRVQRARGVVRGRARLA